MPLCFLVSQSAPAVARGGGAAAGSLLAAVHRHALQCSGSAPAAAQARINTASPHHCAPIVYRLALTLAPQHKPVPRNRPTPTQPRPDHSHERQRRRRPGGAHAQHPGARPGELQGRPGGRITPAGCHVARAYVKRAGGRMMGAGAARARAAAAERSAVATSLLLPAVHACMRARANMRRCAATAFGPSRPHPDTLQCAGGAVPRSHGGRRAVRQSPGAPPLLCAANMQCKLFGRQHTPTPTHLACITSNPPTPCTPLQVHYGEDASAQPKGVGTMASDVQVSGGACALDMRRPCCFGSAATAVICDRAQPEGVGTMVSDLQVGKRVPVNW